MPDEKNLESSRFLLILNGIAYRSTAGGSTQDLETSIGFVIGESANAEHVAGYYGTKVVYRRHPKHNLLVTFLPVKQEFEPGEDVVVKLTACRTYLN